MVKKLTLLLAGRTGWSSLYRSALFAVLLAGLFWLSFGWLWVVLFFVVGLLLYFLLGNERKILRTSYWALVIFSPLSLWLVSSSALSIVISPFIVSGIIIVEAFMFWVLSGLVDFRFSDRFFVYAMLNTVTFLLVFLSVLSFATPHSLGLAGVILFFVIFFLFREAFLFFGTKGKRNLATSAVLGLLGIEISWFVLLLPLGIVNSAVFLTLIFVLMRDFLTAHFRGNLNFSFIFQQLTFLVFLSIIIFATSTWNL